MGALSSVFMSKQKAAAFEKMSAAFITINYPLSTVNYREYTPVRISLM